MWVFHFRQQAYPHHHWWPEAFPILDKSVDTMVSTFINQYLPVHMCPKYILSDNGTELKNQLMGQVVQQLGIDHIFSAPYHPQCNGKLEVFHNYLKPTHKKLCQQTGTSTSIKFSLATEWHSILSQQKHHFSSLWQTYHYINFWNQYNNF